MVYVQRRVKDHHSVRTIQDMPRGRRRGMPPLPTTAVIMLTIAVNEQRRLVLECQRLGRRKIQVERRLAALEGELDALVKDSVRTAHQLRGECAFGGVGGQERPVRPRATREQKKSAAPLVVGY